MMPEHENAWIDADILILGMTYPHYSRKYRENVCTGALLAGSNEMIRIHPIPRRYMDEGAKFRNFQWIHARISKHPHDPRPESYRIHPDSIRLGKEIPSHSDRRAVLESSRHLFRSVEELKAAYDKDRTSMGIIRPKSITGLRVTRRPESERAEWLSTEKELLAQQELYDRAPKKIDFPEARFMVEWMCNDERCKGHEMGLEQWGLHELYRKYRDRSDCEDKVRQEMQRRLDDSKKDIYLFLGNFRTVMYNFGLMDSYSAPKHTASPQLSLLGEG